jgi:CheY-like chemotaxis protein
LTLARIIKNDPLIGDIKLILLSSIGNISHEEEMLKHFACVHVKPIFPYHLLDILKKVGCESLPNKPTYSVEDTLEQKIQTKSANLIRVLVVEDNISNQEVIKAILAQLNCLSSIAKNGIEAIEMCKNYNYDLIFMDLQLPEMNGFEATKAILLEKNYLKNSPPIIAITANVQSETREICMQIGMNDFLAKPIKFLEMEKLILKWTHQQTLKAKPWLD